MLALPHVLPGLTRRGRLFNIYGRPGTGKTTLLLSLCRDLRVSNVNICVLTARPSTDDWAALVTHDRIAEPTNRDQTERILATISSGDTLLVDPYDAFNDADANFGNHLVDALNRGVSIVSANNIPRTGFRPEPDPDAVIFLGHASRHTLIQGAPWLEVDSSRVAAHGEALVCFPGADLVPAAWVA